MTSGGRCPALLLRRPWPWCAPQIHWPWKTSAKEGQSFLHGYPKKYPQTWDTLYFSFPGCSYFSWPIFSTSRATVPAMFCLWIPTDPWILSNGRAAESFRVSMTLPLPCCRPFSHRPCDFGGELREVHCGWAEHSGTIPAKSKQHRW